MVGCVIVVEDQIIAEGYTSPYGGAHAEVNAIKAVKDESLLHKATLYVTLEPCIMCVGALMHARIERVVFGAKDKKNKLCSNLEDMINSSQFNHSIKITDGVLEKQCQDIIKSFFNIIVLDTKPPAGIKIPSNCVFANN